MPLPRRWIVERPYAHRGLHGAGVPENSLAAFDAAVAVGVGIECDVRLSADGHPFVFHDARLERLTDGRGRFDHLAAADIDRLRLRDGSAVPSLDIMLASHAGRTPLLLELKTGGGPVAALCAAVALCLDDYRGPVAVMSFDPRVPAWFASRRRSIVRGLVVSRSLWPPASALRRERLDIACARPHFLARDVRDLPASAYGLPLLCWTVRTGADRRRALDWHGQIIFETD